jgi:methyl-accepting chemotaxis protein
LESQSEALNKTKSVFNEIYNAMSTLAEQVAKIGDKVSHMHKQKDDAIAFIHHIYSVSMETAAFSEEVHAAAEEQISYTNELKASADKLDNASKALLKSINIFKIN